MNTFLSALENAENITYTENGAETLKSTKSRNLDLFFAIGASRNNKMIINIFNDALIENEDLAIRILLWSRDIRGGAGERSNFRMILKHLEQNRPDLVSQLIPLVPNFGRWDDLLVLSESMQQSAFNFIESNLDNPSVNQLLKKWLPRPKQSKIANALRKHLGMTPKQYRKMLVEGSDTVEQKITAKAYSEIEYSKIPSVASSLYKHHFLKNDTERYKEYLSAVQRGEKKINASAIFPHDVIRGWTQGENQTMELQWKALPYNFGENNILPMIDVSGSMGFEVSKNTRALDIALALGVLCATKNNGAFKDYFLTFSETPSVEKIDTSKSIYQNLLNMERSTWMMNTNLQLAFLTILKMAKMNNTPQSDMPSHIIILSDMEFDHCVKGGTNFDNIAQEFSVNGYKLPNLIFWNLRATGNNFPVKFNQDGVALISGYSPMILQSILDGDLSSFDPMSVLYKTVMVDRYNWQQ